MPAPAALAILLGLDAALVSGFALWSLGLGLDPDPLVRDRGRVTSAGEPVSRPLVARPQWLGLGVGMGVGLR